MCAHLLAQLLAALPALPAFALFDAPSPPAPAVLPQVTAVAEILAEDPEWVADPEDNICGLRDLRALSYPAVVDYDEVWKATPEVKKLEDDNIDPDSAEGIRLREAATDRIRAAAKSVMDDEGHCSVWKEIEHEDGRKVPDISDDVIEEFPDDLDRALASAAV